MVNAGATITTGGCNIADWTGTLPGSNFAATDPGMVSVPLRGDYHLDAYSAALNQCSPDGAQDVEGSPRPVPASEWDVGAIEYQDFL